MALGFGVAVFVCFLIPLGAVLLMPAAVAGRDAAAPGGRWGSRSTVITVDGPASTTALS